MTKNSNFAPPATAPPRIKVTCSQPTSQSGEKEGGDKPPKSSRRRRRQAEGGDAGDAGVGGGKGRKIKMQLQNVHVTCPTKGRYTCCNPNVHHQFGRYCVTSTNCACPGCVDFKGSIFKKYV